MTALKISNVKEFMNILLLSETFDHFLLSEASITTFATMILDGQSYADFFSPEDEEYALIEKEAYVPFSFLRSFCLDFIKGKRTPVSFKFVFLLSKENQQKTLASLHSSFAPEDISGMYLNLKYQAGEIICTTGISYRNFSMDKSLDQAWDDMVMRFFKNHKILYESLA